FTAPKIVGARLVRGGAHGKRTLEQRLAIDMGPVRECNAATEKIRRAAVNAEFKHVPEPREVRSNQQVPTIRGQYHTFMLIPLVEHHTRWFDAGPVSIGVESRALGDSAEK